MQCQGSDVSGLVRAPRRFYAHAAACCVALAAFAGAASATELEYAVGADLSFLRSAEQAGVVFKDGGQAKPGLQIFKDHGYNWIRLRLFHTPDQLPNNQEYTTALAKQAKDMGFRFLLDIHYSDTWADPQKQFVPKAWAKLSHEELVEAVFNRTQEDVAALCAAAQPPTWCRWAMKSSTA